MGHDAGRRAARRHADVGPRHDLAAVASARAADIHELSVPGSRPLCGAETVGDPPSRPAAVSCPSCLRLLADDVRRAAHAERPGVDESED